MKQKCSKGGSVPYTQTHRLTIHRSSYLLIMMLFALMLKVDVGWGQGCNNLLASQNNTFSLITLPDPIDPAGGGSQAYELGWVPFWSASHGSPHQFQLNPNGGGQLAPCYSNWSTQSGNEVNCMVNEGLFTNYNFSNDPFVDYQISLEIAGLNCGVWQSGNQFDIKLASGLIPATNIDPISNTPTVPSLNLTSHTIPQGNTTPINLVANFNGNVVGNYNQIWLYQNGAGNGPTTFDNISLTCTTSALTQIIKTNLGGETYRFTAQNSSLVSSFITYNWTITNAFSNTIVLTSSNAEPEYTFSQDGTYKICVNIVDNNGCCASRCDEITLNSNSGRCDYLSLNPRFVTIDCGSSPMLWSQYALTHGIGSNFFSENVYLKGTLIIDIPLTIGNLGILGTWVMDDGAQIVVNSSLSIYNTRLYGCVSMWKGIKVQTGNLIVSLNSIIEDAEYGVHLVGGSVILSKTTFVNNVIGLYAVQTYANSPQNCSFKFAGNLKPPYLNQIEYPSDAKSYAGIKLINTGVFSTGDFQSPWINYFDGLRNGIIGINTNLNIIKNNFINMTGATEDINAQSPSMSGYAIIASGASDYTIRENTISGANIGVSINNATASNIIIRNNNISNFNVPYAYGVKCQNNYGGTIEAFSNTINNGYHSIHFSNNSGSNNRIYSNTISNEQVDESAIDIMLSCGSCNEFGSTIHNNSLTRTKARIGILSLNTKRNQIFLNNINLIGLSVSQEGIVVSNGANCNVTNNNISGNNSEGRGIHIFQSPIAYVSCNWVDNLKTGFFLYGMSPSTNFTSNLMNNQNSEGLELNNGLIGPQSHRSNVWYGNNRKAKAVSSDPIINRFIVDPVLQAPVLPGLTNGTYRPIASPNNWFFPDLGFESTCWESTFITDTDPDLQAGLAAMIAGEGSENDYEAYNRWYLAKEAYKYIDMHVDSITDNELLGFYTAADVTLSKVAEVEQIMQTSFLPTENEIADMQSLTSLLAIKTDQIAEITNDSGYIQNTELINQLDNLRAELLGLNIQIQSIQEQQKLRFDNEADALKILILDLPSNEEYLSDYKDAMLAWVDYYLEGGGYVIGQHLNTLQSIADKCMLSNGEAVILARHVLTTLAVPIDYSDNCELTQYRTSVKEQNNYQIKVMPNPATSLVWIENSSAHTISQVQSLTLDGQIYQTIHNQADIQFIDIKDWLPGIYILSIYLSDGSEVVKKIIKI